MATGFWPAVGIGLALIASAVLAIGLVVWSNVPVALSLGILAILDIAILIGGYWYMKRAFRVASRAPSNPSAPGNQG